MNTPLYLKRLIEKETVTIDHGFKLYTAER